MPAAGRSSGCVSTVERVVQTKFEWKFPLKFETLAASYGSSSRIISRNFTIANRKFLIVRKVRFRCSEHENGPGVKSVVAMRSYTNKKTFKGRLGTDRLINHKKWSDDVDRYTPDNILHLVVTMTINSNTLDQPERPAYNALGQTMFDGLKDKTVREDMNIACADGKTIPAHRSVLTTRCGSVVRNFLNGDDVDTDPVFRLPIPVSSAAVEVFVESCYNGGISRDVVANDNLMKEGSVYSL